MVIRPLLLGLITLAAPGCGNQAPPQQTVTYQYAADTSIVSLGVATTDGVLHVVWVEDNDDHPRAMHGSSSDGGKTWAKPTLIKTGQPPPDRVHRSNDIRVAARGESLVVVWQTQGSGYGGSGPMVIARSEDGGRHWTAGEPPATVAESPSHGFFALSANVDGRFHLAWLDSRAGQQGLHHATSSNGGASWTNAVTVVPATCQCCWNTLAHAEERTYLLYRGIAPRDMALATLERDSTWQLTERVGQFEWHVDGCPHVGGALAVQRSVSKRLHALVWTAEDAHLGVHHLIGEPTGEGWQLMDRIGTRDARNTSLASGLDGRLLATWDQSGEDAAVFAAWSERERFRKVVRLSHSSHRASHPFAVTTADGGYVFWTAREPKGASTWFMSRVDP
ncbi:MAG: sialidase family protein [Aquisalimonadaceae bacterium]